MNTSTMSVQVRNPTQTQAQAPTAIVPAVDKADTESTRSSGTYDDNSSSHVSISSEQELIKFGRRIQNQQHAAAASRHYSQVQTLQLSFHSDPSKKKIIKMKQLGEIFAAIGSGLPALTSIHFTDASFYLPSVNQLLLSTTTTAAHPHGSSNSISNSNIQSIQFHRCKFILSRAKDGSSSVAKKHAVTQLWTGIAQQTNLTVLELVDCKYTTHQQPRPQTFTYELPLFLQDQTLKQLRRLVLDDCIVSSSSSSSDTDTADHQGSFVKLLQNNPSLEELEIHPIFATNNPNRREHYGAKKQAIHKFMTVTLPGSLSLSGSTATTTTKTACLRKLVVRLEEHHLENVYQAAIEAWMDVLQSSQNTTLTDLQMTHLALVGTASSDRSSSTEGLSSSKEEELSTSTTSFLLRMPEEEEEDEAATVLSSEQDDNLARLQENLQYYLRLNEFRRRSSCGLTK